jgi:hypothetical protein
MAQRVLAGFLAMIVASGNTRAALKQLELSLILTGVIDVAPDGSVAGVTIDNRDQITPELFEFVHKSVLSWRFEPMRDAQGVAKSVHSTMRVRLIARNVGNDRMELSVRSVYFITKPEASDRALIKGQSSPLPRYPFDLVRLGVTGDVILAIKINSEGHAEEVAARQVNLQQSGTPGQMVKWRKKLAKISEEAARKWTFLIPVEGPHANKPHWVVSRRITFRLESAPSRPSEGEQATWDAYFAGPVHTPSWFPAAHVNDDGGVDLLSEDELRMEPDDGLRLLTPIGKSVK